MVTNVAPFFVFSVHLITSVEWLEKAWKRGIDSEGASQLGHEVYDTKKWIGTSEMYALLTSFRVKYVFQI